MPPRSSSQVRSTARLLSRGADETRALGQRLGGLCRPGDLILLEGNLGAGKTVLAQGIARGLGVTSVVNSPTFTLIKEYAGRLPLYHLDLYRLDTAAEAADLGIDDYLDGDGVCVVEWAERASALWPPNHLLVRLDSVSEDERYVDLEGSGVRGATLCEQLAAGPASDPTIASGTDEGN